MADGSKPMSWLKKAEEQLNIDIDWMDPGYIRAMPEKVGIVPHDSTSNQLWVDVEMHNESNAELLRQTAKELKDEGWLHIYTRTSVLICKKNIENIQGRVLLQTLPSKAYDEKATIEHARLYDREFKRAGISRARYCIKIPSTGPALNAAKALSQELDDDGLPIATLGTAIFGLPQAIAASQANMLYISPYFNEIRAHFDLSVWPDVEDPATQHPMSARVVGMMDAYRRLYGETGRPQPMMKLASFISAKEVMAAAEFGCHSATVSPKLVDELARLEYDGSRQPGEGVPKPAPGVEHYYRAAGPAPARLQARLSAAGGGGEAAASTGVDYLAGGGAELHKTFETDEVTRTQLAAALEMFTEAENKSKAKIEAVLATV